MSQAWMEAVLREWQEHGRREALGELLKAYRGRAHSTALRLSSPADAEDVVQEAFIKLLSRTTGFEDLAAFEVTVYRAVLQCALDAGRKRKRRERREAEARERETAGRTVDMTSMADVAEREEMARLAREALAELPEEERAPVVLCYYQGLSVVQTARSLELPRETVRKRLVRALSHLRGYLKAHGRDAGDAALLGCLCHDGAGSAPATLCAALDRVLPGRPCADVPELPHPGQAPDAPLPGARSWSPVAMSGALLAAALVGVACGLSFQRQAPPRPATPAAAQAVPGAREVLPQREKESQVVRSAPAVGSPVERSIVENRENREEREMKGILGAVALAGGMFLPGAVQAADAKPDVAKVVAQIQARRAEEAAAAAKVVARYAAAERREGTTSDSGRTEAPVVINLGGAGGMVVIHEGDDK